MMNPSLVVTKVPLRISFAGGGTDLPDYFNRFEGKVLSATINRYVYVTVKSHGALYAERFRLNYFESEHANKLSDIQNDIMRECLKLVPIDEPLYISTVADIPTRSGLGSSSSFAVGLLHALHTKRGDRVTRAQLAVEACKIEIEILKNPIGKQDQYAAAFGGLNQFLFEVDGMVSIRPQPLSAEYVDYIFSHVLLFWTGMVRDSSSVLSDQKRRTQAGENLDGLDNIKTHCDELCLLLERGGCMESFGKILHRTWMEKRDVAESITSAEIDNWYNIGVNSGAYGGKLCGAGGGGFLMLIAPPNAHDAVIDALVELPVERVSLDPLGSQILLQQ